MAENYYDLDYTGSMVDRILDTGYDLQNQGYIFRGLASHYTGTPTERTWLIAPTGSTGFGLSSPVPPGSIGICMYNGSSWYAEVLNTLTLDTAPTTGSGNGITSGAVKTLAESITNAIAQLARSVSDRFTSLTLEDTTGSLQAELLSITLKYVFEDETESLTSISILAATAEKAGLMSAADKQKLDAFVSNIRSLRIQETTEQEDQGTEITNTLKWTIGGVTEAITAFTLYAATTSKAGLMSAADKTALDTLPSLINAGYLYAGIATPSTVPSSTDAKIFYIAIGGGTYTNFGDLNVTQGINIIYKSGEAWSVAQVVGVDNEPTANSDNFVKSGGVLRALALGAVYDVSAKNPTAGPNNDGKFESLSALLSDDNLNTLIPTAVRKGGMSIKFVQSSDNKYIQARCMAQNFTTDTTQWAITEEGVYIENPEFITAYLDSNRKILFGVKKDGNFVFGYGVPQQVRDFVEKEVTEIIRIKVDKEEGKSLIPTQYIQETENSAFVDACTDNEDKLIEATTKEGGKVFFGDVDVKHDLTAKKISSNKIYIGEYELSPASTVVVNTIINDPEGRLEIKTDEEQKIIAYRDENGVLHENVGVKTKEIKLSQTGLDILSKDLKVNWSDYISNDGENPLHLSMPKCARINLLTDFDLTKLSKKGYSVNSKAGVNYDIPIEIEFWDMQGNYFKKKAFIGGQGDSTMAFDKKNIAIDLFDSEWDGDAFSIKFGDWVAQDSFHLKAYDYEPFVGVGAWSYKLFDQMASIYDPEFDRIWKKALWDTTANIPTQASGSDLEESSEYNDTGAKCFPDGFPVIIYQNDAFWGVFSMQMKKHRDNYHMSSSKPNHVFLDGKIGEGTLDANGSPNAIRWDLWEVRNPKNLVYAPFALYNSRTTYKEGDSVTDSSRSRIYRSLQDDNTGNPLEFPYWKDCGDYTYKYDADVTQAEIAGNHDGSTTYDNWSAGSYNIGDIVRHSGHLYMNIVANNSKEPVYNKKNNSDSSPDFKNKTKCGWLNVTNTVKVKENIFAFTTIMAKINAKEAAYLDDPTAENLAAMKAEFETYFDVQNLIDYIIITDVIRDDDAFWKNWLWTTYDGVKWWCNLYDCNISFGYGGAGTGGYYRGPAPYKWDGNQYHLCTYKHLQPDGKSEFMLRYIIDYYADELKQTWTELREGKIIDENNIYNIAKNWIDAVGLDAYALENAKWGYVKHIDNMVRIKKWIYQSVIGLDQLYGYFDNLYADFTIYRSTDRDYTIRCIDMKVSHKLSRKPHYIQGYITRHESTVGGETVSTYTITGGAETDKDETKTYVRVKAAIEAASSQPVDVPSENLFYIEARCENIEYHRK